MNPDQVTNHSSNFSLRVQLQDERAQKADQDTTNALGPVLMSRRSLVLVL